MAFVEQKNFRNFLKEWLGALLKDITGKEFEENSQEWLLMKQWEITGNDKPDIRFGMIHELNGLVKEKILKYSTETELVVGINVEGCADYTKKTN